jgi:hypothetical protein
VVIWVGSKESGKHENERSEGQRTTRVFSDALALVMTHMYSTCCSLERMRLLPSKENEK